MNTIVIRGGDVEILRPNDYAMTVHGLGECAGRTCVIHAPTDHHMRTWRLHWRGDRGIFERLCPHGVGHPDPDQQAYWREVGESLVTAGDEDSADDYVSAQMTHGCDGCCRAPEAAG